MLPNCNTAKSKCCQIEMSSNWNIAKLKYRQFKMLPGKNVSKSSYYSNFEELPTHKSRFWQKMEIPPKIVLATPKRLVWRNLVPVAQFDVDWNLKKSNKKEGKKVEDPPVWFIDAYRSKWSSDIVEAFCIRAVTAGFDMSEYRGRSYKQFTASNSTLWWNLTNRISQWHF